MAGHQRRRETFDPLFSACTRDPSALLCARRACRACFRPAETLGSQVHASAWRGILCGDGLLAGANSWESFGRGFKWWRCCFFSPLSFLLCCGAASAVLLSSGFTGTLPVINRLDYEGGLSSTNPAVHVLVITAFLVFFAKLLPTTRLTLRCVLSRGSCSDFGLFVFHISKVQTVRDHGLDRYRTINPFVIVGITTIMFTPSWHDMRWSRPYHLPSLLLRCYYCMQYWPL
jgi:hypothetical protein